MYLKICTLSDIDAALSISWFIGKWHDIEVYCSEGYDLQFIMIVMEKTYASVAKNMVLIFLVMKTCEMMLMN